MQLDLVRRPAGLPVQALTDRHPKGIEQIQNLHRKGFHAEELQLAKQLARRIVTDEVPELEAAFFRPAEDIHEGLLGSEGSQRCALLENFMDLGQDKEISSSPLQSGSLEGLVHLTAELSARAAQLATWAPTVLDFQVTSRCPFMLLEAGQNRDKKPSKLSSDAVLKWIHIFQRHRFMLLLCLGPESGSLELRPSDAGTHRLQLRPGSLVLLRADCLTHSFSSKGKCFMLTTFLLGPNPQRNAPLAAQLQDELGRNLRKIKEASKSEDDFESQTSRAIQRIANQNLHKGQQTAVRGCAAREPVAAHDPDAFCSAIMAGIDGAQIVPHLRWDHEQYYSHDPMKDPADGQKVHCNHGCFVEGLELFDNKMFKISQMEAAGMDPNQRQALEVFYECTLSAGLDEKKLARSNIGVFMGGAGGFSEFSQVPKDEVGGALASTSGSAAIMANRISFCMGIHGPNFFIDLEGAASLTAFNLAVDSVQRDKAQCTGAVALGVDCNVSPFGLLTLGWAGLLSKKGRCLCFDSYADGYIRGEGFTALYVNPLMKEVDGKKTFDEDPPIIALASGTFINNNGSAASLTAPSGAMYQELVANCLRSADISPLDVDAVECQATGNVLCDAVEATALTRAYRSLAMNQEEEEMLGLLAAKTNLGNMRPAMGCAALLRVIVGQAMGCMPPSLHLHKMNPHIVAADDVPSFFVTEPVQHRMVSAFVACTASGIGGSNAHAIMWGKAVTRQVKMERPVQAEEVLAFWPGGGGDLDPACEPRRGCSIVGSWSLMDTPEQMRGEGLDQFSFTITVGEHGCEWFQIWLDGERERVLHPGAVKGLSTAKVQGPHHYCQVATFGWCIDTRPLEAKDDRPYPDDGMPGDQFKVQLLTKGRFRSVTWERLEEQNVQRNGLPKTMGRYFIVGSWNDWQPEEMSLEDEVLGRFSVKAVLPKGKQRFQILRNRDWRQIIYPDALYADHDAAVKGPDANGHGSYWSIEAEPSRNVMLIDLELWEEDRSYSERKSRSPVKTMKVSWRGIRKQELSEQEVFERSRPSFFLVGSWDCFLRRTKMRFDGLRQCYVGRVPMPIRGELFQILSNGDWNSLLHPSVHQGGMDCAAVRGGGVRGYPSWRIDSEETRPQRYEVLLSTKGALQVQWQSCVGEESSDEELDPELYGPPGVLGI